MLGYTIQVVKPVPQAGLVAQAILPVPTYPRTSATDPCLEQQLRSFRRFAPLIRPTQPTCRPATACTTISPCQRTCFLPSGAPPASPSAPYGASLARSS